MGRFVCCSCCQKGDLVLQSAWELLSLGKQVARSNTPCQKRSQVWDLESDWNLEYMLNTHFSYICTKMLLWCSGVGSNIEVEAPCNISITLTMTPWCIWNLLMYTTITNITKSKSWNLPKIFNRCSDCSQKWGGLSPPRPPCSYPHALMLT